MVLLIILLLILGVLAWLLFSPIRIVINSWEDRYEIYAFGIVQFTVVPTDDFFIVKTSAPFYRHEFDPLTYKFSMSKKEHKRNKGTSPKKKRKGISGSMIRKLLKLGPRLMSTFRVRNLNMVIDTGDLVTNARLVPLLIPFNGGNVHLCTTFNGGGGLSMDVNNRLSRIAYHGFRLFVLNK